MFRYVLIFILYIYSNVVLAINGENLYIKFAPDIIESVEAYSARPINPPFDCPGRTYNGVDYSYAGHISDETHKNIIITYAGPFDGDKRKVCYGTENKEFPHNIAIRDNKSGLYYDVYFSINGLTILFVYNRQLHSCTINQRIGFDFNIFGRYSNKLIGENNNIRIDCGGDSQFSYVITPGNNNGRIGSSFYHPGDITIYKMTNL